MAEMRWDGWGDPAKAMALPPAVAALLAQALDVTPAPGLRTALAQVRLPEPTLPPAVLDELAAITDVTKETEDRIRHTRGKSTVDLLRMRAGEADDAPDAVIRPGSHDEILAILRTCSHHRVAVVPFGGGTSVVGGLAPRRGGYTGLVALDLARLDGIEVDPVSRTATLGAGLTGPAAEQLLATHGFTLGHFPQSFEYATIGGFAATRSSGQYSSGYGRFDEMVVGLRVATPAGTIEAGRAPRSAAGPDLRQLFLGSEGTLGVITAVTVQIRPVPAERATEGWRFDSFADGVAALRALAQDGPRPTMVRLSDEFETTINAPSVGGSLAIFGYEGSAALRDRAAVGASLTARPVDGDPGEAWLKSRFQAPYLRDALLDAGALAETLETAAFWSRLPGLYEAVREGVMENLAGQGTPPLILCHVSHVYPAGASLYFTVVCAQASDPVLQWRQAKAAANAAILAAGGTITHHHAVGRDHADGYAEEVGPLGLAALQAVKRRLDPAGIMNPGILL